VSEIAKALVAARKEIENPKLDSVNPHFKSKFASLGSVLDAVNGPLAKHGLVALCDPMPSEKGIDMALRVIHEEGQELIFGPLSFPCTRNDTQGYASAVTYARRYLLCSVFGLVGEPDDDGNAASKQKTMPEKHAKELADLLDDADPETGDGCDAFAEAWIEMDTEEQKTFAPWISKFWPGQVSKVKAKMHDVMSYWRANK